MKITEMELGGRYGASLYRTTEYDLEPGNLKEVELLAVKQPRKVYNGGRSFMSHTANDGIKVRVIATGEVKDLTPRHIVATWEETVKSAAKAREYKALAADRKATREQAIVNAVAKLNQKLVDAGHQPTVRVGYEGHREVTRVVAMSAETAAILASLI